MKFKENMPCREIKFRAWDKEEKQMISAEEWYFSDEFEPFVDTVEKAQESFEIMQFTGLKDSKGVEIYEDDVLAREGWGNNLIVRFGIGEMDSGVYTYPGFYLEFDSGGKLQIDRISFWNTCEVIGNIYEHPDLIKG